MKTDHLPLIEVRSLESGQASVSVASQSIETAFDSPFDGATLEAIRWYIEDYGKSQFGGEGERAKGVEAAMIRGGVALHDFLCSNEKASSVIEDALASGTGVEVSIASNSQEFLSIPWELAFSQKHDVFLASNGIAFFRAYLPKSTTRPRRIRSPGPLRVLLIMARPKGLGEVPLDTVVSSLARLASLPDAQVELHLLRPPTIARFREVLSDNHEYDIVHFDGHGEFLSLEESVGRVEGDQGFLFFETEDSRPEPVNGREVARQLNANNVPVFILNACRSAFAGRESAMSSVASQLLIAGSPGVIAMSYSVRADAVRIFMNGLYNALASGKSLLSSVTVARNRLSEARTEEYINDSFVPLLYLRNSKDTFDSACIQITRHSRPLQEPASFDRLFGRERELLLVERAFATKSPIVVVCGMLGTGKTEFLDGFSSWLKLSQGVEEAIYLDIRECRTVSDAIGKTNLMLTKLRHHHATMDDFKHGDRLLVAWDHAECLVSNKEEQDQLHRLRNSLGGSGIKFLIATCEPIRAELELAIVPLIDLSNAETARRIREGSNDLNRSILLRDRNILERVIESCSYHPRSVDLLLKAMETLGPQRASSLFEWGIPNKRDALLDGRVIEVFERLSDSARSILPLLGLFGKTISPLSLVTFTNKGLKHDIFAEWYDSPITKEQWRDYLEEAAELGFVRKAADWIFEIPATVQIFLRHVLRDSHPAGERLCKSLANGMVALYAALASEWERTYDQSTLFVIVRLEESNMVRAILTAVRHQSLPEAIEIFRVLDFVWRGKGHWEPLHSFVSEIQLLLGEDLLEKPQGEEFWALLRSCEAQVAEAAGDISRVEEIDKETLRVVGNREGSRLIPYIVDAEVRLASCMAKSGSIEESQRHLIRAEEIGKGRQSNNIAQIRGWLRRRVDDPEGAMDSAHLDSIMPDSRDAAIHSEKLGGTAMARGDYDAATQHYAAALRTWSRLGREEEHVNARGMLADAMVQKGDVSFALQIYKEVLQCHERKNRMGRAAKTALLIGQTLEQAGSFMEARHWCESVIPVMKRLGMQLDIGHVYHELAIIAATDTKDPRPEEAIERLNDAVRLYHDLGSTMHQGSSLSLLGQIYLSQGQYDQAGSALRQSRSVWPEPAVVGQANGRDLRLAAAELQLGNADEAIKLLALISNRIDLQVSDRVTTEMQQYVLRIKKELGEQRFHQIWRQAGGNFEALK